MSLSIKFNTLLILFSIQILICNTFIDPYDENAKVYIDDGHITFESAHNKDISFKSNFGSIKLNGVQIQDLLKLINNYKNDQQQLTASQQPAFNQLNQQIKDLNEKLKNYERLQDDVNELKDTIKQMLNDNKIKPDNIYKSVSGYKKMKKLFNKFKDLMDANECESNPCKNSATCLDLFGDFFCQCPDGWSGKDCSIDIDECKLYAGTTLGCQNNAQCINTPGSYHCICKNNYQGTHCTSLNNACSQSSSKELCGHGQCVPISNRNSSDYSYSCVCDPGWKKDETGVTCNEDIDECELHRKLITNFLENKQTALANLPKQICSIKPLVECFNSLGSFHCGPCPKGYIGNGQYCYDINECETNNGGCSIDPYVQCINTEGSRHCGPCPEFYSGDGTSCTLKIFPYIYPKVYGIDVYNSDVSEELCPTNPCLNEAVCYLLKNSSLINKTTTNTSVTSINKSEIYCSCDLGFTGKLCETIINYCINDEEANQTISLNGPCLNNGTCLSLIGGFTCMCKSGWQGETCEEQVSECGTEYRSENGTIKFPNGEFVLQPNRNSFTCEWKIDTLVGKVIEINLKNLSLDYSPSCMDQYLKISDGIPGLTENRQLIKWCGNFNDLPKNSTNITSAHNFITIQLYDSNWSEQNEDSEQSPLSFELDFHTKLPSCGGLLKNLSTHGSIKSPGYSVGYPHFSDCTWILKANLNKRIQLYFADLSIEEQSSDCLNDYVEIFDGETEEDPSLGRFCNSTIPAPITSSGPFVLIRFVSDAFNTDKGFFLTYNTISGVENCGGLYTSNKGTISSPLFQISKYENNLQCDYLIRLKGLNDKIKLKIDVIDLEKRKSGKCYDFIEIFDGSDELTSKSFGKFCDNKTTNQIFVSSSNTMLIKFRTDKSFRANGFSVSYEKFCAHSFTDKQGVIKSDGYPKLIDSGICFYEIKLPENNLIKLEFEDLDILDTVNCTKDSLVIIETIQTAVKNNYRHKYCGDSVPDNYISKFNHLFLILTTKVPFLNLRGFKLKYSSIDVKCGGVLDKSPGFFSSPTKLNSQTYESNLKCAWLLSAPTDQIIKLTFNTFSVEKDSREICKFDYVRVLDSQFNEIGKFCGNQLPPPIQSTDNELIVEFVSDKSKQLEGFSASYVFANQSKSCGGNIAAQESGEITSPNFYNQKKYSPNSNCVWHLVAPPNRQIRLNFTFLELEANDCFYDTIKIYNGPETGSPLLASVCGHFIPPVIISHSNQLTIQFVSDQDKEGKGFILKYDTALTGCGGLITSNTGSISSPNYPKHYLHNAVCDYLIYVSKGSTINLNFAEIDIEPQDLNCEYDYIELFDGRTEFDPKIGKYCHKNTNPGILRSSSNAVLIRFRSDAVVGKKGFLLNYSTNCTNMNLNGYRGIIETLNFPSAEFGIFNCMWQINVPRGNKINLVFTNLILEENNEDCSKVSLTINELVDNQINKNSTKKLCSSNQIDTDILNYNTQSNIVQISFKRDQLLILNEIPKSLFRLEWNSIGCGGEYINKISGQIMTPDYPKIHSYELDCVWHIISNPGNRIILNIIDFDISTGGKCVYGYVKVLAGRSMDESNEIGKICEKPSMPIKLTSPGSSMTIILKNGLGISGKGLNAMFNIERGSGCGGVFTSNEATLTSPNWPALYDSNSDCYYAIESSELKRIQITIEELKLPTGKNCSTGELLFFNGRTEMSPLIRKECGQNINENNNTITSTSNKMLIRFKTNGHAVSKGFKFKYKMICGGSVILTKDQSYTLKSPNYPFPSLSNRQCNYTFICDYNQKMAVTITHLEPSNNYFQTQSYLKFFAGQSLDSPLYNTYSKSIPNTFVLPGNGLRITSERIVFRLKIDTIMNTCGGNIKVTNEGEIASPNFPMNYPLNVQCDWLLNTGLSNRIQIEFLDFKLQETEFCNIDYLEIRVDNKHGKLIGRYCGNEMPTIDNQYLHAISQKESNQTSYEMGFNRLWIRFKSDITGSDSGFRMKFSLVKEVYLTEDRAQISSSSYPNVNVAEEGITWHITTSENTLISLSIKKIQLTMLRDTYCLSQIIIYDGFDINSPILKTICGYEPPSKPIISTGNMMTVTYYSHGMSLFLLEYNSINQLIYETNKTSFLNSNISESNCFEEIYLGQNETTITSPGYPSGYINDLNCTWIVHSQIGRKIVIKVEDLDIENVNCYYDKLNIYHQRPNSEIYLNQTLCGRKSSTESNKTLVSNSNYVKIEFISDSVGNGTGFRLSLSTQWGGIIFGERGLLKFNAGLNDNLKCEWIISGNMNKKLKLKFNSINFNNRGSKDCVESFVLIKDISSQILGKYCNRTNETLEINETPSNAVSLTFFALKGLYQSFSLSYEEIKIGCVQKYKLESREDVITIQSPNISGPIDCEWIFSSLPSTSIRIDFKILNPNIPCNTSENQISIYNGGSQYSPLIARDCPRISSVITTENMMFVNYITNGENLHSSFEAKVQIAHCGGTYIIRSRIILKSKNYPSKYLNNLNCKYYFHTQYPSYIIQFKITKLDLANNNNTEQNEIKVNNTDCDLAGDFLEIRDIDENGPIIQRFCNSNPKTNFIVRSYSDHAFVLFKTDSEGVADGFNVEISLINEKCGNTISGATRGIIKTPNLEKNISLGTRDCKWTITAPISNRIELTFKKVNLKSDPTNPNSCIDRLQFYAQPVYFFYSKKIKAINTNTECNFIEGQKIISFHNSMVIELKTHGLNENEGFIIEYNAQSEAICGGEIKSDKGTLEMSNELILNKNYTLNIGDTISCLWYLNLPDLPYKNYTFVLKIEKFDFPDPIDTGALNEFKNLESGSNLGRSILSGFSPHNDICGNNSALIGISQKSGRNQIFYLELCSNLTGKNLFYIYPHSDSFIPTIFAHMIVENKPKTMKFSYELNKCGNFYTQYGTYNSPKYDGQSNYDNNLMCVYIFKFYLPGRLELEFEEFDLEDDRECENDYVQIFNGDMIGNSPDLGNRLCGNKNNKKLKFISSGPSISLIFKTNNEITGKGFQFTVKKYSSNNSCGIDYKLLNYPQNIIKSPNYPNKYSNLMNCEWNIEVQPNYHMSMEFLQRFDLEKSINCTNDYLVIEEKESENKWKQLGDRICGIQLPEIIKTNSNVARIRFKTNNNVTGDGFQIKIQKEYGRIFDNNSPREGVLISPNYPSNYPENLNCTFIFNRTKNDFIVLKLDDWDISDCPNDNLVIIRDKNYQNSTIPEHQIKNIHAHSHINSMIHSKYLGPFCDQTSPPKLLTSNEYMKLVFTTDSTKSSRGFKFNYKIIECGKDFNMVDYGVIESPNFNDSDGNNYINNADCYWNIVVEENYTIALRFELMKIETCGRFCHCDHLEITESTPMTQKMNPLAKLCGFDRDMIVKSNTNNLNLHFHSDHTSSAEGFRLIFKKTIGEKLGCGKTIFAQNQTGYIESPDVNKDGKYEKNLDCVWTITAGDKQVIKLKFESFSLEERDKKTNRCRDFLQINDGSSTQEPLIDSYCGSIIPANQVQSSSNRLFIYFKTDDLNESKGFKIKYELIDKYCGQEIYISTEDDLMKNYSTQYILSPNYPLSYENNIRCLWNFNIPFFARLELNILEFNLNCSNNDYLQLSFDRKHEHLIKLCSESEYLKNKRFVVINGLWLLLNSGQGNLDNNLLLRNSLPKSINNNQKGNQQFKFKISYKVLNCNATHNETNGMIVSSQYPSSWALHGSEFCKFTIETEIGRTISVYFNEFLIGRNVISNTCNENRMEIKDGNMMNSRIVAKLCGNYLPNPIFSSGNVLSFNVRSINSFNKYSMYYTTTKLNECGGNFTSFNGTFTNKFYPEPFKEVKTCVWNVHSLGQNKLKIKFNTFEFSSNDKKDCNSTLEIYDGQLKTEPVLVRKLCPFDNQPADYDSLSNYLIFKLIIKNPNDSIKFKINYNIDSLKELNNQIFTSQSNNKDFSSFNDAISLIGN